MATHSHSPRNFIWSDCHLYFTDSDTLKSLEFSTSDIQRLQNSASPVPIEDLWFVPKEKKMEFLGNGSTCIDIALSSTENIIATLNSNHQIFFVDDSSREGFVSEMDFQEDKKIKNIFLLKILTASKKQINSSAINDILVTLTEDLYLEAWDLQRHDQISKRSPKIEELNLKKILGLEHFSLFDFKAEYIKQGHFLVINIKSLYTVLFIRLNEVFLKKTSEP